jgi:ubiquitin C-terminal hydrolase
VYYPNEDKWKNYNDTVVKKVTEAEVLASNKDSYVLFYVHEKCWPKERVVL